MGDVLFSRNPDGTKADAWIHDEILGDDPPDPDYTHILGSVDLVGNEHSGNFGHAGRPGQVGGSAPDGDGSGDSGGKDTIKKEAVGTVTFTKAVPESIATRVMGDTTQQALAAQILDDVPGNLKVEWLAAASKDGFFFKTNVPDEEKNTVVMSVSREGDPESDPDDPEDDENRLVISRSFTRLEDGRLIVRHNSFKLPEGEQGHGIAKSLLSNSLDIYQKMGVDEIRTQANINVGGYAWAKFGFKAQSPRLMADNMLKRVTSMEYGSKLSVAEGIGLKKIINQYADDPNLPWHIANTRMADGKQIGKTLLVGSSWAGSLSLHDQESVDRLTHYTRDDHD